jgi:hypothetical protein
MTANRLSSSRIAVRKQRRRQPFNHEFVGGKNSIIIHEIPFLNRPAQIHSVVKANASNTSYLEFRHRSTMAVRETRASSSKLPAAIRCLQ